MSEKNLKPGDRVSFKENRGYGDTVRINGTVISVDGDNVRVSYATSYQIGTKVGVIDTFGKKELTKRPDDV